MLEGIHYWGISEKVAKAHIQTPLQYYEDRLSFDGVVLRNFISDCGAVCMSNISALTTSILKDILIYCKLSGYSVILSTVVGRATGTQRAILEKGGFVCADAGYSHRCLSKTHHVYVLRIPEEEFIVKGYEKATV